MHGIQYMRAGILCLALAPEGTVPLLPGTLETPAPLGELIDAVNRRFGTGTLALGGVGVNAPGAVAKPAGGPVTAVHHRVNRAAHRLLIGRRSKDAEHLSLRRR